jgi:hypothetical protein
MRWQHAVNHVIFSRDMAGKLVLLITGIEWPLLLLSKMHILPLSWITIDVHGNSVTQILVATDIDR